MREKERASVCEREREREKRQKERQKATKPLRYSIGGAGSWGQQISRRAQWHRGTQCHLLPGSRQERTPPEIYTYVCVCIYIYAYKQRVRAREREREREINIYVCIYVYI